MKPLVLITRNGEPITGALPVTPRVARTAIDLLVQERAVPRVQLGVTWVGVGADLERVRVAAAALA